MSITSSATRPRQDFAAALQYSQILARQPPLLGQRRRVRLLQYRLPAIHQSRRPRSRPTADARNPSTIRKTMPSLFVELAITYGDIDVSVPRSSFSPVPQATAIDQRTTSTNLGIDTINQPLTLQHQSQQSLKRQPSAHSGGKKSLLTLTSNPETKLEPATTQACIKLHNLHNEFAAVFVVTPCHIIACERIDRQKKTLKHACITATPKNRPPN